jgi:hypothetical protein
MERGMGTTGNVVPKSHGMSIRCYWERQPGPGLREGEDDLRPPKEETVRCDCPRRHCQAEPGTINRGHTAAEVGEPNIESMGGVSVGIGGDEPRRVHSDDKLLELTDHLVAPTYSRPAGHHCCRRRGKERTEEQERAA